MFDPENDLERLMQAAARDPGAVPAFYRALLASELYVLAPETPMTPGRRRAMKYREAINVATVAYQGLTWVPAFTAKSRISAYVKEPETCLGAKARDLFTLLPKANFWLNPLSECQKPMPAEEVHLLITGGIDAVLKPSASA